MAYFLESILLLSVLGLICMAGIWGFYWLKQRVGVCQQVSVDYQVYAV